MSLQIEITANNRSAIQSFNEVSESSKKASADVSRNFEGVERSIADASNKTSKAIKKSLEELRAQSEEVDEKLDSLRAKIDSKKSRISLLEKSSASLKQSGADQLQIGEADFKVKRAREELLQLEQAFKSTLEESIELGKQIDGFGKVESFVKITTELRNARNEMAQLARDGKAGTEEYDALASKIKELSEASKGVDLATDNDGGFQAFGESVNAASGALTAATGVIGLFNSKSESLSKMQTKLQSVMAISIGLQQMMALTYKTSAARIKILTLWKKMAAAATGQEANASRAAAAAEGEQAITQTSVATSSAAMAAGEGVATGATITLTGAMRALGVAIKSIPLVGWILAGISAVIAIATAAYDNYASKREAAEKRAKKAMEERAKAERKYHEDVAGALSKDVAGYKLLQARWSELKTESEKNEFIKANADEFSNLGVTINSVSEAEAFLVKNTSNVMAAFKARAQAAALENRLIELYDKQETELGKLEYAKYKTYKEGDRIEWEDRLALESHGYSSEDFGRDGWNNTIAKGQEQIDIINSNRRSKAIAKTQAARKRVLSGTNKEADKVLSKIVQLTNDANAVLGGGQKEQKSKTPKTKKDDGEEKIKRERQEAERLEELRARLDKEDKRARIDREFERRQDEINMMADTAEKKLEQLKLNHDKEIEALDREQEDLLIKKRENAKELWEAENPDKVRKGETWKSSGASAKFADMLTPDEIAYFSAAYNAVEQELYAKTAEMTEQLTAKYKDYSAQRLDIEKSFNADIEALNQLRIKALSKGDTAGLIEYTNALNKAKADKANKLSTMDADNFIRQNGLDKLFANISGQSVAALKSARNTINARMANASPSEQESLNKKIKDIEDEIVKRRASKAMEIAGNARELSTITGKLTEQGLFGDGETGARVAAAFDAAASASEAYAKLMSGDVLGALNSGLDATLSLFTAFGIGEGNMDRLQKDINLLSISADNLSKAFDDLRTNLNESNRLTAKENYDKAKENLSAREQTIKDIVSDRLHQWERGSHSLGYEVDKSSKEELSKLGLSSIFDLLSLSSEDLDRLLNTNSGDAWSKIMARLQEYNNEHNGDAEQIIAEIEALREMHKEAEELDDTLAGIFTGMSFDEFRDNFRATLKDMSSDVTDFTADLETALNNIAIDRITDNYENDLRNLYDEWVALAQKEGGLTEDDRRYIERKREEIAQLALDERQALKNMGLISTNESNKAGSTRGFEAASSEQIGELNGRFTAIQVSNQGILNGVQALQVLAVSRNSYLDEISSFCKNISSRVVNIETHAKTTADKL